MIRKTSLKWQIALVFMSLNILVHVLSYIFANFFMEGFFISQNRRQLLYVHRTAKQLLNYVVENPCGEGFIIADEGEDIYLDLVKKCSMNNISMYLFTSAGSVVVVTGSAPGDHTAEELYKRLKNSSLNTSKILDKTPEYVLQLYKDKWLNTDYIELIGNYEGGYMFVMRTDLQAIRQHVSLSNQFVRYAFILVVPVSFFLIWYFSVKVSKPIIMLSKISERMAKLDFDVKFEGDETNEIGRLGTNINKLSSVLEGTISELRTANTSLTHDIKKKEENEKRISEFIADLSHELKTPIALIQGYAEGLKEFIGEGDAESREFYCDVIMDEADKMNHMLKQLINLNSIELDYNRAEMRRFNLIKMIENILNSYSYAKQQKNIDININVQDNVKNVWGDSFKIEEVINNYLTNAIDHVTDVDGSGKKIEIVVRNNEGKARIEVFNTGEPIPEEDIDRIWSKFFKVDRARNRQFGGSGIGLSIVKAIMNTHNQAFGAINYQNGVKFYFELDLA